MVGEAALHRLFIAKCWTKTAKQYKSMNKISGDFCWIAVNLLSWPCAIRIHEEVNLPGIFRPSEEDKMNVTRTWCNTSIAFTKVRRHRKSPVFILAENNDWMNHWSPYLVLSIALQKALEHTEHNKRILNTLFVWNVLKSIEHIKTYYTHINN